MTIATQNISYRVWNQLTQDEKLRVISDVRDDSNKFHDLCELVNDIISTNIEFDVDALSDDLRDIYGIDADFSYSFYGQGSGLCFDAKSIDVKQLLIETGFFENKMVDLDTNVNLINEYLSSICVYTKRINNYYDHENSVRFVVEDQGFHVYTDDDEESPLVTEYLRIFFEDETLEDFLNHWLVDYCKTNYNMLEESLEASEDDISEILEEYIGGHLEESYKFVGENESLALLTDNI